MEIKRIIDHLLARVRRPAGCLSQSDLQEIQAAIDANERTHSGEILFIVERSLPFRLLARRITPRERAIDLFSRYRVWDTRHNNGVLLYLMLADRDIEIVADRGINERVGAEGWSAICGAAEAAFRAGKFTAGVQGCVAAIGARLAQHFPPESGDHDELPDKPVVLEGGN